MKMIHQQACSPNRERPVKVFFKTRHTSLTQGGDAVGATVVAIVVAQVVRVDEERVGGTDVRTNVVRYPILTRRGCVGARVIELSAPQLRCLYQGATIIGTILFRIVIVHILII